MSQFSPFIQEYDNKKEKPNRQHKTEKEWNGLGQQQNECEECHTKRKVIYRPLVSSSGSFLCDECYKVKFPATAMIDLNHNQNIIVRKYNERVIRKTQNNLYNQSNNGSGGEDRERYSEEEECCKCLEKGFYRKCCKKYYCHQCYYNQSRSCPGCGASVHRSGATIPKPKPSRISVLFTWGVSLYLLVLFLGVLYTLIAHNLNRPETVWNSECHGWFPTCDRSICIEADRGEHVIPTEFSVCSLESIHKVTGKTCIVDSQLYHESDGLMGYDICRLHETSYDSTFLELNSGFDDGIYVFEDDFDYWINSTDYTSDSVMLKSAQWSKMINAQATDICGFNPMKRPYKEEDHYPFKKSSALVFSGVQNRQCETSDLDVRFGGRVEFYIKLAPVVENELATECKSSFGGNIRLLYSVDNGFSWSIIETYEVWKYRSHNFTFVNQTIPLKAQTNSTRFRFDQPMFEAIRDFWALDDTRVFAFLDPQWRQSEWFENGRMQKWLSDQNIQCCLDTEQCLQFPNYKSSDNCNTYSKHTSSLYRIKIVDMFIISATVICLIKKGCHDFQHWLEDEDEIDIFEQSIKLNDNDQSSDSKRFQLNISKSWQVMAFILTSTPYSLSVITLLWHFCYHLDYYQHNSAQSVFFALALGLDFWTVRCISMNIYQFWPCSTLPHVKVDKSFVDFKLWVGEDQINILDISSIDIYSERFYWVLFACVLISSLPLASASILIKMLQLQYDMYIVILELLGCALIFRSIVGPLWFVELYLSITWIFSMSGITRDDMGRAIQRPSVRHVVSNAILLSILLYIILLVTFEPIRSAVIKTKILICILVTITGATFGAMLGMIRGLPVAPLIYLTTWPSEGFSFVNERCTIPPHTWAKIFGGGMNSVQFCTLQVENQRDFRRLISGASNGKVDKDTIETPTS